MLGCLPSHPIRIRFPAILYQIHKTQPIKEVDHTMGNKITPESVAASPNSAKRDDLLAKEAGLDDYAEEQERSLEELPDQVIILNTPPQKDCLSSTEIHSLTQETDSLISSISDVDFHPSPFIKQWDHKTLFSDFIQDGLILMKKKSTNVVMLYESPSSSSHETSFFNSQVYKFHDYPPSPVAYKAVLAPCRYSLMNGATYPSYLRDTPPEGLIEHWRQYVPGFVVPPFVHEIPNDAQVYAYLPVEHIAHHVNDPHVHYHIAGNSFLGKRTWTLRSSALFRKDQC
jgi:hypothetical protein